VDLVGTLLQRAAGPAAWPPLAGFGAGVVSSFGPCAAPRFFALINLTAGEAGLRRWARIGSFVAGLCGSYVLLGSIAGALGYLNDGSTYAYAILGTGLICCGLAAIVRTPRGHACATARPAARNAPLGTAFVAGLVFVGVGSPCCGPIVAAVAGTGLAGGAAQNAALLGAFALGHATPLVAAACGWVRLGNVLAARVPTSALATVGGAVMMALGSYYALLA